MKKLLSSLGLLSALSLLSSVSYADWWIDTVDVGDMGGTSIAIDLLDYPHIAYNPGLKAPLMYASWNPDSTWTKESIFGGGGSPRIRFDSKDMPHIAWTWKYGYRDTAWHIVKDIENDCFSFPLSLSLDNKDYPHIAYFRENPSTGDSLIMHLYLDSTGWHDDTVHFYDPFGGPQIHAQGVSITVNDSDQAHLVYCAESSCRLVYAKKVGEVWEKEMIDTTPGAPFDRYPSLVLDTLGLPCIAYARGWYFCDFAELRYAKKESGEWKITVIDSAPTSYYHPGISSPSLCIDSQNHPRICYMGNHDLKYTWFDGISWNITTLDTGAFYWNAFKRATDMTVDSENKSHITYQHYNEKLTKYAKGHEFMSIEESEKCKVKSEKLEVWPNPFVQSTIVRFEDSRLQIEDCKIQVYDIMGRLVEEADENIIGKKLQSGIYFVKVQEFKVIKLIKMGGVR